MAITKEDILAKCSAEVIASRDLQKIADIMSVGRTQNNGTVVGTGTILEVLGIAVGNALLDAIYANNTLKYVRPLIEQGRLSVGSPLVQATLNAYVPSILTQDQANLMFNVGRSPEIVSTQDVEEVLYNPDGSLK